MISFRHSCLSGHSSRFIEDTFQSSINCEDKTLSFSLYPHLKAYGEKDPSTGDSLYFNQPVSVHMFIYPSTCYFLSDFAHDFHCLYEANSPRSGNQMVSSWFLESSLVSQISESKTSNFLLSVLSLLNILPGSRSLNILLEQISS